jgi:cellulose synthase/poly-beta-1,6-N-acetylglucosamine synthase-like glycosyltransferase
MRDARPFPLARIAASATLTAATAINGTLAAYLGLVTIAGARRPQAGRPSVTPTTKFVILVPAHDEEAVIADTLRSFAEIAYPAELFKVHVVADNCSDSTADIVRAHGRQAHERHAPEEPGKGPALNWLFDRLDADGNFDVAVVIDADTIVDPGFLSAMDDAFGRGAVAAQGYYSVRAPGASPAAGVRYAALACRHHLRPLGRRRLGASCGLYGNGMAFRRDVLRRRRWTGHLVEDAEFQMELLIRDGEIVTYVPGALVEAEMPSTLDAAESQNARWERGRIEIARRYVPVLARMLPHAPRGRRVAYADAIADHLLPPLSAMVALQSATFVVNIFASALGVPQSRRRATVDVITLVILGGHVVAGLRSVTAPPSVYRSLGRAPAMVVWKVGLWRRALRPATEVTWQRTTRNSER